MLAERAREVSFETTVRERLDAVESALLRVAEADSPMVTEAAQHVIAAGGKRFRPLLVVKVRRLDKPELVIEIGRHAGRTFARRTGDQSLLEIPGDGIDEAVEAFGKL